MLSACRSELQTMPQQTHSYSAEEIVAGLYRSILAREPDPGGLRIYTEVLEAGRGVEHVAALLMHSAEFRDRLPMLGRMIAA